MNEIEEYEDTSFEYSYDWFKFGAFRTKMHLDLY